MPPPYKQAPGTGGDRPPFELILDGASNPPPPASMALTVDAPEDPSAPAKNSFGALFAGSHTGPATQTGLLGHVTRMNRATGTVDHAYKDLTGVIVREAATGLVVTSVTAGVVYTVTLNLMV